MMTAWEFRGDEIFVATDEDGVDFHYFSCRFEIIEKIVDMVSGAEQIRVKISNGYSNPMVTLKREELAESAILNNLTRYGVSINDDKEIRLWVREILMDTESNAKLTRVHSSLGFTKVGEEEVFLADKIYGSTNPLLSESTHIDPCMRPKGGLNRYRHFLIKEVVKHPQIALAFVLGATAPVAHLLKKGAHIREVPVWCFSGVTSTGKTTMLCSLLSLYGKPDFLLSNLHATANALSTQISQQAGLPFVADEATHSKLDFDDLIYSLTAGKDKRRCNGDGSLKPLTKFSGAMFFSSEHPILDKCDDHGGEEARVLDFEFDWFDGDGQKAERFSRFFNSHYGVAVAPLMQLIFDNRIKKNILKNYRRTYARLLEKANCETGIDRRIISKLALILVSGWLLQKALKVDFHLDEVEKLLWQVQDAKKDRTIRMNGVEMLLQLFTEDMVKNPDMYIRHFSKRHARHAQFPPIGKVSGSRDTFKGRDCVWIPQNQFQKILDQQTQYGSDTAKRMLHEAGYLEKFGKSYYRWYNFGAASTNSLCLYPPSPDVYAHHGHQIGEENNGNEILSVIPTPPKKLVLGFVRVTAQDVHMVLNNPLSEKMNIGEGSVLWVTLFPRQGTIWLGRKETSGDIPLTFKKEGHVWVSTCTSISSIISSMDIKMNTLSRILLTDINCYADNVAIINYTNPFGQWCGDISIKNPYDTRDVYPEVSSHQINPSLLDDEDEAG
jgi:hypothetical protein